MKDEIKEIKIKTIGQLLDYVETEQKAKELINYITNLQEEVKFTEDYKDAYETTMIANKMLEGKYKDYKSRNENAQDLILNELSHLKAKDEETWNKEFYDENNKLDYRKLCIELLNQVINLLDGGDEEC